MQKFQLVSMINAQVTVVIYDELHTCMRVTLLFVYWNTCWTYQTWTEVNSYCQFVRIQTGFGFWSSVNQMLELLARGQHGFIRGLDLSHKCTVYCSTVLLNIANNRPKINLYSSTDLEGLSFLCFCFVLVCLFLCNTSSSKRNSGFNITHGIIGLYIHAMRHSCCILGMLYIIILILFVAHFLQNTQTSRNSKNAVGS